MLIEHTGQEATCPWPATVTLVQGGRSGIVFRPTSKGGNYATAFVEVFSPEGGFIRGEGPCLTTAERVAWEKYQARVACSGHEYEARGYRNGGGICKHCGRFKMDAFTPEELGCFCKICGTPTFSARIDDDFYCADHASTPETLALRRQRLLQAEGTEQVVTGSALGDLFERLDLARRDDY